MQNLGLKLAAGFLVAFTLAGCKSTPPAGRVSNADASVEITETADGAHRLKVTATSPGPANTIQALHVMVPSVENPEKAEVLSGVLRDSSGAFQAGCWFNYDQNSHSFVLYSDTKSRWVETRLNSGPPISSSYCSFSGAESTAEVVSNQLALTVPVKFTNALSGKRGVYVAVTESDGSRTPWKLRSSSMLKPSGEK